MYLAETLTILTKAMRNAFDTDSFPDEDFRHLPVEVEYPVLPQQYPSVWVDFQPVGPLSPVGIGQIETVSAVGGSQMVARWAFGGYVTFVAVTMSSLQRARLVDALISIIAFRDQNSVYGQFRNTIETSSLIILQPNYHEIDQRGFSAAPGTPWGTDEMMYEATIAVPVIGEFVSDPATAVLVDISGATTVQWVSDAESDPTSGGGWLG